ncbi:MAG: DUF5615 family PIN-like protein [Chloroflexota bacterium]
MTDVALRFLADESCDFGVVRALREAGYDVLAVSEVTQRSVDRELIEQAGRETRILLAEDKDFGWLVFVSHVESPGVILIRALNPVLETLFGEVASSERAAASRPGVAVWRRAWALSFCDSWGECWPAR